MRRLHFTRGDGGAHWLDVCDCGRIVAASAELECWRRFAFRPETIAEGKTPVNINGVAFGWKVDWISERGR